MGSGNQRDVAKILREERRDAVAQAIADMLLYDYHIKPRGEFYHLSPDNPEFMELVTRIRKVMDQAYAQA